MILHNARVISPIDNIDDVLDIKIENGIVVEISKNIQGEVIDLSGKFIVPGLVDMHCHLREPGFEYKETLETGMLSAISGGYTTICPMANTNPVVDNIQTLNFIVKKAADMGGIFLHQICAVTKGLEGKEITDFGLLKQHGAIAFSDDGKPISNSEIFKAALRTGELIISHAENITVREAENEAECVARELDILRKIGQDGCRLHFAHLSTKGAIESVRMAKKEGLSVTCETAPHYFTFTNDDVTSNGRFKMNPPLASSEDLMAVIEGLKDGTIDCIATDHAPHSIEEKSKPFAQSPFGIVGFETSLGASLKLVNDGHLTMNQLIEKMSVNPAKILGLNSLNRQGQIKIGEKANLTIIDPDIIYKVDETKLKSKCKITPWNGKTLKGKAIAVIANGVVTFGLFS